MIVVLNPGGLFGLFLALIFIIDSVVNMEQERFFADAWSQTLVRRCYASLYYSLFLLAGAIGGNLAFEHIVRAVER